jgi:hypothetical protein
MTGKAYQPGIDDAGRGRKPERDRGRGR